LDLPGTPGNTARERTSALVCVHHQDQESDMPPETTILMSSSRIKFGPGATREVGYDMRQLGARRVMVVTDPNLARSETVALVLGALRAEGLDAVLYCTRPE